MQLNLMQKRATIKRRTPTMDGLSLNPGTPETVASGVACLIQEKMGGSRPTQMGERLIYDAVAYLPINTDIEPRKGTNQTDTLVVESHPTIPVGSEFLVVHVANRGGVQSLAAQHLQAFLKTP